MAIAMEADLVARFGNESAFFRKGFEGVAGNEERGFDIVFVEQL